MTDMPRCKTCHYWKPEKFAVPPRFGICGLNNAFKLEAVHERDGVNCRADLAIETGDEFGCVLHEAKP